MKISKRIILTFSALVALAPLIYANGLNLNSLGTRALTMGGAFVGMANDFSAIFWNPAGLTNITKRYVGF